MTEAQRKQLEEMAEQTAKVYTGQYGDPAPATLRSMNFAFQAGFGAGATAAWEMREAEIHIRDQALSHGQMCHELELAEAVKTERELERKRCAYAFAVANKPLTYAQALAILNPPSEGKSDE